MMRKFPSADSSVGESGRLNVKSVPTERTSRHLSLTACCWYYLAYSVVLKQETQY